MAIKMITEFPIEQPIDGLEIHPCKIIDPAKYKGDKEVVEQCEEGEEDFWSVYVHFVEGGLQCIADYSTKSEAMELESLLNSLLVCNKLMSEIS